MDKRLATPEEAVIPTDTKAPENKVEKKPKTKKK